MGEVSPAAGRELDGFEGGAVEAVAEALDGRYQGACWVEVAVGGFGQRKVVVPLADSLLDTVEVGSVAGGG